MPTLTDLYAQRWALINKKIPYVPETGIATFWRANPDLGSPIGFETDLDDGSIAQAFANGIVRWTAASGASQVTE